MSDHEHGPIEHGPMKGLPAEYHTKWHEFIERVNAVADEMFSPEDELDLVLGAQWGELGGSDLSFPTCLVTTNMPPCVAPGAAKDIVKFLEQYHEEFHERLSHTLAQEVSANAVPDHIRAKAEAFAASMGFRPEDVVYVEHADTSDLDDLPETEEPT